MDARHALIDAAHRPSFAARQVLAGLGTEVAHARPGGHANSIVWLLWHAARQQDAQLATLTGADQVWSSQGWAARLGIDRGPEAFGFGDTDADAARLRVAEPARLAEYLDAVIAATVAYVGSLSDAALDKVIDTSWTPPVTRGVRLISIIEDAAVHVGQAAYARGVLESWRIGY